MLWRWQEGAFLGSTYCPAHHLQIVCGERPTLEVFSNPSTKQSVYFIQYLTRRDAESPPGEGAAAAMAALAVNPRASVSLQQPSVQLMRFHDALVQVWRGRAVRVAPCVCALGGGGRAAAGDGSRWHHKSPGTGTLP